MDFSKLLPVRRFRLFTKLDLLSIQDRIREGTEPMGPFSLPELFQVKKYETRLTTTGFTLRKKTRTGHDANPIADAVCSKQFDQHTMISVTIRPTIGGLVFMIIWFGIVGGATAVAWCAFLGIGLPYKPELKQPVSLTALFILSYAALWLSSCETEREYKKYLQDLLFAVEE